MGENVKRGKRGKYLERINGAVLGGEKLGSVRKGSNGGEC